MSKCILIYYMMPVKNKMSYEKFKEGMLKALPSLEDYNDYFEHWGKAPINTYEEQIEIIKGSIDTKYESYLKVAKQVLSIAIDLDDFNTVSNAFDHIKECDGEVILGKDRYVAPNDTNYQELYEDLKKIA